MIFIGDQLVTYLQSNLAFPSVKVSEFYSDIKLTPPLVTIDERPGAATLFPDAQPALPQNTYQVEVYTKPMTIGGIVYNKISAAKMLLGEVATLLNDHFGLTQSGDAVFSTYVNDPNVGRGVVRFRGIIDLNTEIIYR